VDQTSTVCQASVVTALELRGKLAVYVVHQMDHSCANTWWYMTDHVVSPAEIVRIRSMFYWLVVVNHHSLWVQDLFNIRWLLYFEICYPTLSTASITLPLTYCPNFSHDGESNWDAKGIKSSSSSLCGLSCSRRCTSHTMMMMMIWHLWHLSWTHPPLLSFSHCWVMQNLIQWSWARCGIVNLMAVSVPGIKWKRYSLLNRVMVSVMSWVLFIVHEKCIFFWLTKILSLISVLAGPDQ